MQARGGRYVERGTTCVPSVMRRDDGTAGFGAGVWYAKRQSQLQSDVDCFFAGLLWASLEVCGAAAGRRAGAFGKSLRKSAGRLPHHDAVVVVWPGRNEARVTARAGTDEGAGHWRGGDRDALSLGAG